VLRADGYRLTAFLSLALLEAGILFVNYIKLAFSANDFAVGATLLNGCSYFHFLKLCAASCSLCELLWL